MAGPIDTAARVKISGRPPTRTADQTVTAPAPRRAHPKIAAQVKTQKVRAAGLAGVQDSKSAGRTFKVRAAAAKNRGENLELNPAAPPKIQLSAELIQGAESFAGNLDALIDGLCFKRGGMAAEPRDYPPQEYRAALEILGELPLGPAAGAATSPAEEGGIGFVNQLLSIRDNRSPAALDELLGVEPDQVRAFSNVSAESLISLFLILNISDPNNSPETHNDLYEIASTMRQLAIDDAQAKSKLAQKLLAEAERAAERAAVAGVIAQVALIVVTVVLTVVLTVVTAGAATAPVVTGGAAAVTAVTGGSSAAVQATIQTAIQIIRQALSSSLQQITNLITAAVQAAVQITQAAMAHEASLAQANANEADNETDRARQRADQAQNALEEETAIIQLIMESKNQTIDAVTKMLASQMSAQRLVAAATMVR